MSDLITSTEALFKPGDLVRYRFSRHYGLGVIVCRFTDDIAPPHVLYRVLFPSVISRRSQSDLEAVFP